MGGFCGRQAISWLFDLLIGPPPGEDVASEFGRECKCREKVDFTKIAASQLVLGTDNTFVADLATERGSLKSKIRNRILSYAQSVPGCEENIGFESSSVLLALTTTLYIDG